MIAHNLDQLKAFEAAITAYDYLIDHLPSTHPWSMRLRVQRIIAQLATHRLTDADEGLRRMRPKTTEMMDATTCAALRLAALIQQVRTYHWSDAAASAADLLGDLRPLGVEAGYGHALLALSYHHLADAPPSDGALSTDAQPTTAAEADKMARLWWSRATVLLPAPVLVDRFPELGALASQDVDGPP